VTANSQATSGAGIYNNGSLVVNGSVVSNNVATPAAGDSRTFGGGILNEDGGSLVVAGNSSISGNSAVYGAGIYGSFSTTSTLTNSTVNGNIASLSAGGIFAGAGTNGVLNGTTSISGNTAGFSGGGVNLVGFTNFPATLTLNDSSSISGNHAPEGGGVFVGGLAMVTLNGGTVTGNTVDNIAP
jgi:hypothetical protein